ncbi:MAG TPA: hypothetical protein P5121_30350, partial [Caldilineaceae bacterium]|nr:hypothetical protein [Caldilineaceae bacterium]
MKSRPFLAGHGLLSIVIVLAALLLPALPDPLLAAPLREPSAPTDTPIPVVSETLNEWTIGNGLLYWA